MYTKKKLAVKSKCRALSVAINCMMYLLPADAQYEELFKDLTVLYKKVCDMVPAEAGIFLRLRKCGRKLRQKNTSVLKLRKKRNKKPKTAGNTAPKQSKTTTKKTVIPQDSIIIVSEEERGCPLSTTHLIGLGREPKEISPANHASTEIGPIISGYKLEPLVFVNKMKKTYNHG